MKLSQEIFQYYCSTAANPIGYGVYEYIGAQLLKSQAILRADVGEEVFNSIPALDLSKIGTNEAPSRLTIAAYAYVCLSAFYEAIPQLDLALSDNGFGVISNQNVAPASADRVERLRKQISDMADDAFDDLHDALRGDPRWCETIHAKRIFSSLIWRCSQLEPFGYPHPSRSEYARLRTKIALAEIDIKNMISTEQFMAIANAVRRASEDEQDIAAISLCVDYCAAKASGEKGATQAAKFALLQFVESDLEKFAIYANSSAYNANHFKGYENEKKDSCYFF